MEDKKMNPSEIIEAIKVCNQILEVNKESFWNDSHEKVRARDRAHEKINELMDRLDEY